MTRVRIVVKTIRFAESRIGGGDLVEIEAGHGGGDDAAMSFRLQSRPPDALSRATDTGHETMFGR
ncbi:MAG: hypothetical protein GY856_14670 [bacterium]|nr:hypothetical protein [bacterium]